jgi:CBS domain-containing protein
MARVKDVVHRNVPTVDVRATVLEATKVMNENKSSGVAVVDGEKVVGVLSDRRLLTTFFSMNKEPGQVKVSEVMSPLYRIGPEATLKEAARKIVENGITRLGVFDGDRFLGWVSLSDLSRQFSKRNVFDVLREHGESESSEFLCQNCQEAFMQQITDSEGQTLRWRCPKCGATL